MKTSYVLLSSFIILKNLFMPRNRRNSFWKTIKDYTVPIIGLLLIAILIFSFFFSFWSKDDSLNNENQVWINVALGSDSSEAYVIYPWDNKKQIEQNIALYKWEKIVVKNWTVSLDFPSIWNMNLNKIWELKYNEDWELFLFSSDLWVNNTSPVDINMRYWTAKLWENSVVSLTQNEMWSTVYLIDWFVETSNITGRSTVLAKWQKITIPRQDSTSTDVNLSLLKESIDDYFKSSDWFIKNNGEFYLSQNLDNISSSTSTWQIISSSIISFDNLFDESSVQSSSIDINWKYNDEISKITLNWLSASLNEGNKTFSFKWYILENKENDLVFKVYDNDSNIIKKYVYTVYHDSWIDNSLSETGFQVTNFEIDASDFRFSSPSTTWTYITYDDFVTIKWVTPAETVFRVSVNGYTLKSFNWTSWRYHARTDYNNLKDGTNLYEVKYYWSNDNLIYTNYFTIIKKVIQASTQKQYDSSWNNSFAEAQKVISDEAKIN